MCLSPEWNPVTNDRSGSERQENIVVPSTKTERLVSGWMVGRKEMNITLENNGFKMPVSHTNT